MAYERKKNPGLQGTMPSYVAPPPPPSGPAAPAPTSQQPGAFSKSSGPSSGTGWVNLQDYLGLNQHGARNMAGDLAGKVSAAGGQAQAAVSDIGRRFDTGLRSDANYGRAPQHGSMAELSGYGDALQKATDTSRDAKGLVNFSDRQRLLSDAYGKGGDYSPGMGRWDGFAAGAAGGDLLKRASDQYGGLAERLGVANEQSGQKASAVIAKQGEIRGAKEAAALKQAEIDAADRDWYARLTGTDDFDTWRRMQTGELHSTWLGGGRRGHKAWEDSLTKLIGENYGEDFADRYGRLKTKYGA